MHFAKKPAATPAVNVVAAAITIAAVSATVFLTACSNPKDCYEKGDAKACSALCDTGKPENTMACFEIRARAIEACADGKGDCTEACQNWQNSTDEGKKAYTAKLGSKVTQLTQKCTTKK